MTFPKGIGVGGLVRDIYTVIIRIMDAHFRLVSSISPQSVV